MVICYNSNRKQYEYVKRHFTSFTVIKIKNHKEKGVFTPDSLKVVKALQMANRKDEGGYGTRTLFSC